MSTSVHVDNTNGSWKLAKATMLRQNPTPFPTVYTYGGGGQVLDAHEQKLELHEFLRACLRGYQSQILHTAWRWNGTDGRGRDIMQRR